MESLTVSNFGPIKEVNVKFGDLTFFVGPQASGKSLFLELLKLIVDKDYLLPNLRRYNYVINRNPRKVIDMFFGDGMNGIFKNNTRIKFDGIDYDLHSLAKMNKPKTEKLFYIPAQRILSMADGRPRNFMEFDMSTPYVLRAFSEALRIYMQNTTEGRALLFPVSKRLQEALLQSIDYNIFHGGKIVMEEISGQKKMKMHVDNMSIPFMTWSAGQKEFTPLLMAFYCLSIKNPRNPAGPLYDFVVIEEPEMGLHPQAIQSVLLEILELLKRGIKVMLSTHSTTLLDFAWAFNILKKSENPEAVNGLFEMFNLPKTDSTEHIFEGLLKKEIRTYYFSRGDGSSVTSTDITSLDPGSENADLSQWGGLSQFDARVTDIVLKYSE